LIQHVVAGRVLREQPLCLVDVGASGGIEDYWRQFNPDLEAFGFDPMVEECARLNAAEPSPRIRYFAHLLGWEQRDKESPPDTDAWSDFPFTRTSAARAQELLKLSYPEMVNVAQRQTMSGSFVTLDGFFAAKANQSVDFVKVDTDGHDYEVLRGGGSTLRDRGVLGLLVEVPFHGRNHPHSQLFLNIDRFLRENGFGLFDIETYRYSRACLPDVFLYDLPAQTARGQVIAADVLYFRDVCAPDYARTWSLDLPALKLVKLACLFELFGMPDCAAEVIVMQRDRLEAYLDCSSALDLLAGEFHPQAKSYAELRERFESDPKSFYPSADQTLGHASDIETLRNELRSIRSSRSWRITAPLRRVTGVLRKLLRR